MKRSWVLGVIVAGLAGGLGYAVWARADAPPAADKAPRMGKYVLVHDRVTNTALPVERPELQMIGGKPFLVGVGPAEAKHRTPAAGRPVWVNLEDACTVIHFDALADLEKAVAEAREPRDN